MPARQTIWKWAGIVDDVRGRIAVLWWTFVSVAAIGGFVWYSAIRTFGVVGTAVLILSAVSLLIGTAGGIDHARRSPKKDGIASTYRAAWMPTKADAPLLGGEALRNQVVAPTQAPQLVFEEAPPELADVSPASLKNFFGGRTDAQGDKLMEQHVAKAVRVSGEVARVELGRIPQVHLESTVDLLLFFDADDDDAEPLLLALNKGDKIVVSRGRFTRSERSSFLWTNAN